MKRDATAEVNTLDVATGGVKNPKTMAFRVTVAEQRAVRIAAARANKKPAEWLRDVVLGVALKEAA
jgi:hypothetical protein